MFNNGLEAIGDNAFAHSSLNDSVFIPASVSYIGDDAFSYTRITDFSCDSNFRGTVGQIYYCLDLETVNIPASFYSINKLYLGKCPELTYIDGLESQITKENIYRLGMLSRTNPSLFIESEKNNIKYLGFESYPYLLAVQCIDVTDTVVIADECKMILSTYKVTEGDIEEGWSGYRLPIFNGHENIFNELILPEGLWYIEYGALCGHMKHINVPNSLIAFEGFVECENCYFYSCLEEIYIPANCDIAVEALIDSYGSVPKITIEAGHPKYYTINGNIVSREDKKLIYGTTPYIPSDVVAIGEYAFRGASFTSINIPSNVLFIEFGAFEDSQLETVTLNEGLLSIGRYAFDCQKLKAITIPASVVHIACDAWINKLNGPTNYTYYGVETVYYNGTSESWDRMVKGEYFHVGDGVVEWFWTEPTNLICLNQQSNQTSVSNGKIYEWMYAPGAYMGIHPQIKVIDGELYYLQEATISEKVDGKLMHSNPSLYGIVLKDGSIMLNPEDGMCLQPLVINGHNGFGCYQQEGDAYMIEGFYESNGEYYVYYEIYIYYPYELFSGGEERSELVAINNCLVSRDGDIYILIN